MKRSDSAQRRGVRSKTALRATHQIVSIMRGLTHTGALVVDEQKVVEDAPR
jgi:hypothetical protein